MSIPYTYLIGWKSHDTWYYGVRWSVNCDPSELWVRYFTSSKAVAAKREEWGEPDVIEIRRTFVDPRVARAWEERVIHRLGAVRSSRWLNRGNGGRDFAGPSEEGRILISKRFKGVPKSAEHRQKLSEARQGKSFGPHSEETRAKIGAARIGIPRNEEVKAKLRAANLGKAISPDAIAKSVAKHTGSKRSEETKARMRAAWEKRRAEAKPLTQEERMAKAARLIEYRKAHPINTRNEV